MGMEYSDWPGPGCLPASEEGRADIPPPPPLSGGRGEEEDLFPEGVGTVPRVGSGVGSA